MVCGRAYGLSTVCCLLHLDHIFVNIHIYCTHARMICRSDFVPHQIGQSLKTCAQVRLVILADACACFRSSVSLLFDMRVCVPESGRVLAERHFYVDMFTCMHASTCSLADMLSCMLARRLCARTCEDKGLVMQYVHTRALVSKKSSHSILAQCDEATRVHAQCDEATRVHAQCDEATRVHAQCDEATRVPTTCRISLLVGSVGTRLIQPFHTLV
jgi:hypothetical protein